VQSQSVVQAQSGLFDKIGGPKKFGRAAEKDVDLELSAELLEIDERTVELRVTTKLPKEYYIYSMNPDFDGKSSIELTELGELAPETDAWTPDHDPKVVDDPDLGQKVEKHFGGVTWSTRLRSASGTLPAEIRISGTLSGQFCTSGANGGGGTCVPLIPPREFTATLKRSARPAPQTSPAHPDGSNDSPGVADGQQGSEERSSVVTVIPEIAQQDANGTPSIQYQIWMFPQPGGAGSEVVLNVKAIIQRPWHTFALDQDPDMAGLPTEIQFSELQGLSELDTKFVPSSEPVVEKPFEDIIHRVHYDEITWSRKMKLESPSATASGTISFQMCREKSCLPPSSVDFQVSIVPAAPGGMAQLPPATGNTISNGGGKSADGTRRNSRGASSGDEGLVAFLLAAAGAGFLALLTPCVFPMIPITVAFFLKQEERQAGSSLRLAFVYSLTMVGAFTILGLLGAVLFGPTSLQEAANNRWLNLVFAALFLIFCFQLIGWFPEIRIPSWLLTWSSKREEVGGFVGVIFMALTFTLVSFTCTFSFVGGLFVLAAKGSYYWPVVGMLAFSTAFASPFFVLSMFPSMLSKMPRSGGWMNDVKVTIGLIELALVPKFLSVADIGFSPTRTPRWITYQTFMWSWIAIAAVTGIYLISGLFMKSRSASSRMVNFARTAFAVGFLAFSAYLYAGLAGDLSMGGTVWKLVAAFAPPDIHIRPTTELGLVITHHEVDYSLEFEKAVRQATELRKPLFVDFTGVNCVNCRQMERTVLAAPEVTQELRGIVCAQLYTDEVPGVPDAAMRDQLKTLNISLQRELIQDVTLPCYAVLSSDGKKVLAVFEGLDSTGGKDFREFLTAGLDEWKQTQGSREIATSAGTSTPAR
ncbi:MAG: protein-disulfide reductase DsbD family protein, partial [Planctomyces sp.]